MELVDARYQHLPKRHAQLRFASNASLGTTGALLAAAATGLANLIVYYRVSASAVASFGFLNGSGGTNFLNGYTLIHTAIEGPWWDPTAQGSATPIFAVGADGIGSGVVDIWYVTMRRGAGPGATTQ